MVSDDEDLIGRARDSRHYVVDGLQPFVHLHLHLDGGPAGVAGPYVPDGKWGYFALVMNGAEIILYVDGVETDKKPVLGVLSARASKLTLAKASNDNRYFRGSLDEVAIYAKALTPQRILAHYARGKQ